MSTLIDPLSASLPLSSRSVAPYKLLVGLVGAGIQHSLSPAMHEQEARQHGVQLHYQLIDLASATDPARALPALLDSIQTMGFAGFNVTFPCKQSIIPLLDDLSDEARAMGAVNTVVNQHGRLIGHNTDGSGWRWGFERALPQANLSRVVLLGAGGAGSAIAHALMRMQVQQLVLVDPDQARSQALADQLNQRYPGNSANACSDMAHAMQGASGLVHATPTGMAKFPGLPVPSRWLQPSLWVAEVVYFPLDTELLQAARAAGCATVDGGTMAVGQALGAFEHFTGLPADPVRMENHFRQLIADNARSAA